MKARYVRVSSQSQNPARQLKKEYPNERLFIDVISGSVAFKNRPAGQQLFQAIEAAEIDYISVSQLDRLGRSAIDIQNTLDYFKSKGITVKIDNLGVESLLPDGKPNPSFKMITDILANLAEMARESIRENQAQGIAAAKAKGKGVVYKGRVKGTVEPDDVVLNKYKAVVKELQLHPDLSLAKIASICNDKMGKDDKKLSPNTVRKVKLILERQKG